MINLTTGQFYGQTNELIQLDGLTLTDTEYTHDWVDWHYHQNAYFTFILEGCVLEGNKKETYHCSAGSLLFHYWQESHYNRKPPGFTRGFHIELEPDWLAGLDLDLSQVQGSLNLIDPQLKVLLYKIFREFKLEDSIKHLAIQSLLIEAISRIAGYKQDTYRNRPDWAIRVRDLLHDAPVANWTLPALAQTVGVHPVHLSRSFPQYFNCTLSHYIRSIRVQHSLALMAQKTHSLTAIALACGFADQSHFIRCFQEIYRCKPTVYRSLLGQ
ncbi:helix-turn-helix transcriptional regulator [Spirosoma sp. BT702]|uniref:Helix-turn-helix transcriptional regulator n=1 Tax=Spirosoma profusum TaxID=2771354 RepID=A0A927AWF1_9BACT|nr:helix-turn-helix transcriptional regulator [Spirosoma profusum]MBD2705662.1 helix-turn-helix transcriptional regulator [Spirosoma profusum]